ncbi:putative LEAF RUST 10 DISEASE-RESISTANCE LOCUS RECEPTOR-LIKE PROTEIN KINASE-like 2.3 [Cocos nucifera]|nr:putative LEAF RUST 10 DISEASE-RESISTANCE LOCUS RECEPTOR-LIKE PROTEIN KINASE-like 2.3 [Cocos nucifera]
MVPVPEAPLKNSELEVFKLFQKGFTLLFDTGSGWSRSWVLHNCLGEAKSFFQDHFQSSQIPSSVSFLVKSEMHFLHCMNDYAYRSSIFWIALVMTILTTIVQFSILLALLGRCVCAPLTVYLFLAYKFWSTQVSIDTIEKFLRNQQNLAPTRYAYTDIIAITNHFNEKLGQGGFGSVFKGKLAGGHLVAVKMLGNSKCNGEEFINEVSTIGRIHHVNIVKLVGFCSDGSKRALVYEYMPNGSLDKYIFSSNGTSERPFTWDKLNDIALGVARGINYLHQGCDMQILHFDIKPHNILLDQNFTPKISDFGLAKLYPKDYSLVSISAARGTIGYIAPELISRNFGVVSYKSDVYSFGMLLLELSGGRRNVDPRVENSSQIYYPSWIYDQLKQREALEICDTTVNGELESKLSKVGLWCIQMKSSNRPSMGRVIEMLEADVDGLQMPPRPFFSSPQPTSERQSCVNSLSSGLSIISERD